MSILIPIDQSRFGKAGDCWAACIASILERPIEDFDLFHELYRAWGEQISTPGAKIPWEVRSAYPLELVRVTGHAVVRVDSAIERCAPTGYSIANGPGSRGADHSCVAFDGRVVHDPHPSRAGLIDITSYEILVRIVWPNDALYSERINRPPLGDQEDPIHAR